MFTSNIRQVENAVIVRSRLGEYVLPATSRDRLADSDFDLGTGYRVVVLVNQFSIEIYLAIRLRPVICKCLFSCPLYLGIRLHLSVF